ncbi:MAG: hypothetical protein II842_14440 [Butyrivibrio sp.]|nr:hypothetical protein [Butyrivibrio sp.]
MNNKALISVNIVIVVLEIVAFIHDCYAFGISLFEWYTVDSNVLQLIISALIIFFCIKDRPLPSVLTILHFISAVGLTVTFLIAAFVLAPEGGIAYYFLENVAPINHFIGPLLSVISLLFLESVPNLPLKIIFCPAAISLFYGVICLILNWLRILDGPYFFLKVYEQQVATIVLWFVIIALLCIGLAFIYYKIKWRKKA